MGGTSRRRFLALVWIGCLACTLNAAEEPAKPSVPADNPVFEDAELEFFEKEVRPILSARCLECHGGGKGDPKGGLLMTSRGALLKGGDTGPAVVPGNLKDSLLISAIEYGDLYQMPPKSKLPANEIAVLKKWVERRVPWPKETASAAGTVKPFDLAGRKAEHWCWRPIEDPAVPAVQNQSWPMTSVDRFILSKLEASGLTPAGSADKHVLLRRAYFDLIGLPPTPDELSAFINDRSPNAFEQAVDRLLSSVHFGERWARHWLDLVRYAETRGHEFEPLIPNAWQYRDYVIRGLNADVSYDRFLLEHVAGDLIEPRWRTDLPKSAAGLQPRINESVLGTGFWFLGEEVHSPVDIRKDETDRMDNRLDVMTKTFLGLTVSCARCHDHKFDAISQHDYYALTGFLISGSYRQVRFQTESNDQQIAESLDKLRAAARQDIAKALANATRPTLEKLDQILLAALEAVDAGIANDPTRDERKSTTPQIVFADFEGDSYGEWKSEGTAFGQRPPKKSDNVYEAPLTGFQGERLVNSHRNSDPGSNNAGTRDAQTGRLISPTFTIDLNTIRFLIGGGDHPGRTCINLEVDGKIVRTATGQNSGKLRPVQWQVAELRGKQGRIEIVDSESGGWGHVLVDQIVFTNDAATENITVPPQLTELARLKLNNLAVEKKLDAEILSRWCLELAAARMDPKHLLHRFMSAATARSTSPTPEKAAGLVVDFGAAQPPDVIQNGVSFGLRPATAGLLQLPRSAEKPGLRVATLGGWERDLFWKGIKIAPGSEDDHGGLGGWRRHGRMVRTPEFVLDKGRLWYLIRGSVRAYASVNSHLVVAGPLHGGTQHEFKHTDQQWHWVAHGLDLYRGHRLHVEFSPGDDNECCIAMVVQSDDAPAKPSLAMVLPSAETAPERARLWQSRLTSIFTEFIEQQLSSGSTKGMTPSDTELVNWILEHLGLFASKDDLINDRLAVLSQEESQLEKQVQWESQLAPAMLDGNGVDELLLIRGNSNTPRDPVHRRFLEACGGTTSPTADDGSGRLALGRQILQSPLAARVAVNRIWYHLFGRGIVPTVDNLGVLGQPPTHPELLDHLATQFMKDGWSTKRMIKALMMTRTYQMSSHPAEPGDTSDPDNLLWHRMPIRRLEGEVIRDALLAVSGRLDRTSLGISVPIHLTPFMEGRGRPGVNGPLDGNGRRSIYIAVRRNFLSPMMLAFDTPSPFSTVGRRTTSNVPAQALILMNDPFVIDVAKQWAKRILADASLSIDQRISLMYLTAFSRLPTDEEKSDALEFLDAQSTRFGLPEAERKTSPQAWTDLCHVMFNLKEFVFVE